MMVWSTYREWIVSCWNGNGNWTDQVVVILISWSSAVVDPVRLGHLVYLFFSSSQTKETRVELYELKSVFNGAH